MKYTKRFIAIILTIVMMMDTSMVATATTFSEEISLINTYVECLDTGNIDNIRELLCEEEQEEFTSFISNEDNFKNKIGYYNYKSAELVAVTESTQILSSLDYNIMDYANIERLSAWECIIDVETYEDTKFLHQGNNKFIIVLGNKDDGIPVIIGVVRDKIWSEANCCEEDSVGVEPLSYDAPVSAPSLGVWTMPSTITVQSYGVVDFKHYCNVVTMNEFGTDSYNENARKAVALAVKNVGWNRTLVQKYSGYGYDVKPTTADQVYNPSKTPTTKVINAVNAIWNYVMLSSDYKLFCAFFVSSSSTNSYAKYHGGILSQTEANYLGTNGYTWQNILHYFYDYGTYNSEMTSGVIKIVDLGHASVGKAYSSNATMHWQTCTVCGCIHSKTSHTWVSSGTIYKCTVCGRTSTNAPGLMSVE